MAHFALLDSSMTVVDVVVVANEDIDDLPFPESESVGQAYLASVYGKDLVWRQTSYNSNFRTKYAGVGDSYSADYDAFIPPAPFADWVLDPQTRRWAAPIPYPDDGARHVWNPEISNWEPYDQSAEKGKA